MQKKENSFFKELYLEYLRLYPEEGLTRAAKRARISKQNLWNKISEIQEVKPGFWPKFRKALKMTRSQFWKRARFYYDPE